MSASHRFNNALRNRSGADIGQVMLTPAYVLEPIRAALGGRIGLDPCTEIHNPTGAEAIYYLPHDGVTLPWDAATVFCNPPYGTARQKWAEKCASSGKLRPTALLMPSHTDVRVSQFCAAACDFVCYIRGRVRFAEKRKNGAFVAASHGSAVFCWKCDPTPLHALGVILRADK